MTTKTVRIAALLLLSVETASTGHADQNFWDGARAIQDIHHQNMQEFNDFCASLPQFQPTVGMNVGGGFNGGGPQQNPQTVQLVTQINSLLLSDMNPQFRNQLQQAVMQIGLQYGQNGPTMLAQALFTAAQQLENQPGDDNQRGALVLYLNAAAFQGAAPEQIATFLGTAVQGAEQRGRTWHRKGNFGALINQAAASSQGGLTPVQTPFYR